MGLAEKVVDASMDDSWKEGSSPIDPSRPTFFDEQILAEERQFQDGERKRRLAYVTEELNRLHDALELGESLYMRWKRKEPSGKVRPIAVPKKQWRTLFKDYLLPFIKQAPVHTSAHGAEKGWSTERSLSTLLPCRTALSFDLRRAMPSFTYDRARQFFNKLLRQQGFDEDETRFYADFLSNVTTVPYHELDGHRALPIGSPLTNALFNRSLNELDAQIQTRTDARGLKYVRWLDDFTIASGEEADASALIGAVQMVEGQGLQVHPDKTFYQTTSTSPKGIFLLGYKIIDGDRIAKNSAAERAAHKPNPLNLDDFFGKTSSRTYESWG